MFTNAGVKQAYIFGGSDGVRQLISCILHEPRGAHMIPFTSQRMDLATANLPFKARYVSVPVVGLELVFRHHLEKEDS